MNREDVAMDVTFDNLDILRKEVQAAKMLLSECDEIFSEEGICNIELRGYLSGKLSAGEVIELLDPPAEQRNQCDGCQAGIPLEDGAHRMGRLGGYPDLMSCQKERYAQPEQAEGAHVPDEVFEAEFMTWWEDHGQYCRSGGGDYERTFAFQAWRHLYPKLMQARAALAQPSPKSGNYSDQEWINAGCPPEQLSPAPELERPEVVAVFDDLTKRAFLTDSKLQMSHGEDLMTVSQHDRIVRELQEQLALTEEVSRGFLRAAERKNKLAVDAQAKVAKLEGQAPDIDELVGRFLSWKLPDEVCADPCAATPFYPDRFGTNLLNWEQAKDMLRHVLSGYPVAQAGQVPEGWKLVPIEPTKDQWGGLARAIVFWMRSYQSSKHTPATLIEFITSLGHEVPEWMGDEAELRTKDHVISKGTAAVLIYKAMLAAAPAQGGE